jgi:hypothetical protein
MTRMLALYPRRWRDRYEEEFLALLSDSGSGPGDGIDIVRGAVDAHIQRLWPESPDDHSQPARGAVLTGLSAAIGGLAWLGWTALILLEFRGWGAGQPEHAALGAALALVAGLASVAAIVGIASNFQLLMRRGGLLGASLASIGYVLSVFGGGTAQLLAFAGVAIVAWSLAGRVLPTWLAALWIASAAVTAFAFIAFVSGGGQLVGLLALALPQGAAWVLVGIAIASRRPRDPRLVDPNLG